MKERERERGSCGEEQRLSCLSLDLPCSGLCSVSFQGNVVLWKPSDTALLSSYAVYKVLLEAGLPPNVIQFVPADGPVFGDAVTASEHFCGLNFTGSVP